MEGTKTGKPVMGVHSLLGTTNNGNNNNVPSSFHPTLPTMINKSPLVITTPPTPVAARAAISLTTSIPPSSPNNNTNNAGGGDIKIIHQPVPVATPSVINPTKVVSTSNTSNSSDGPILFAKCTTPSTSTTTTSNTNAVISSANEKVSPKVNSVQGQTSTIFSEGVKVVSPPPVNVNSNKINPIVSSSCGTSNANVPIINTTSSVTTSSNKSPELQKESRVVKVLEHPVIIGPQPTGQATSAPGQRTNPLINPNTTSGQSQNRNNQGENQSNTQSGNNFCNQNSSSVTTSSSVSKPASSLITSTPQTGKVETKTGKMDTADGLKSVESVNNNKNMNDKEKIVSNGKCDLIGAQPSMSAESTESNGSSGGFDLPSEMPSRPVTAPASLDPIKSSESKDAIGDDVKMVIKLLEKSGLCGPQSDIQSAPASRPGTANPDFPPARPNTAERPPTGTGDAPQIINKSDRKSGKERAVIRPPSAERPQSPFVNNIQGPAGDSSLKNNMTASTVPTTKDSKKKTVSKVDSGKGGDRSGRPTTARSRPSTAVTKTPRENNSEGKMSNGNAEGGKPKSGRSGGTETIPVVPKLSRSGRTSTPRAASARVSTSTSATHKQNQSPLLNETEKTSEKITKRAKSLSLSQESRPKSAISASSGRESSTGSTPRSRPSSTLYQHTASSAQKGKITPPASATSSTSATLQAINNSSTSPSTLKSRPSTRQRNKMGDSAATGAGDAKPATLKDQFAAFSRFGDTASDGKHITLSNSDKWMKQAHVIDGKKITTTDTSICFKKLFKTTKKVPLEDFKKYIEDLSKSKKIEPQVILDKLTNCGAPGLSTATKAAHAGVVERLTDTSKYTGSHKERFDATGKGKGIEGRRDVADSSGYVASFKTKLDLNKDSSKESSPSPTPVAVVKEASPPK